MVRRNNKVHTWIINIPSFSAKTRENIQSKNNRFRWWIFEEISLFYVNMKSKDRNFVFWLYAQATFQGKSDPLYFINLVLTWTRFVIDIILSISSYSTKKRFIVGGKYFFTKLCHDEPSRKGGCRFGCGNLVKERWQLNKHRVNKVGEFNSWNRSSMFSSIKLYW
jgi:hypothetical protein